MIDIPDMRRYLDMGIYSDTVSEYPYLTNMTFFQFHVSGPSEFNAKMYKTKAMTLKPSAKKLKRQWILTKILSNERRPGELMGK